jgi:hypothetical protein
MANAVVFIQKKGASSVPIIDVSAVDCRVQEARLLAALLESGWALKAREIHWVALRGVSDCFPIEKLQDLRGALYTFPITIDHPSPQTTVGPVTKPLVFPEWMFDRLKSESSSRPLLCSFVGFLSAQRVADALALYERSFGKVSRWKATLLGSLSRFPKSRQAVRVMNWLFETIGAPRRCKFRWTNAGRQVENKVFDRAYWNLMNQSQSVYCPAGDFGWSYRFYESIMSGALPIIDKLKDEAFAKDFFTVNVIPSEKQVRSLEALIERNRRTARLLVTAREDLRPNRMLQTALGVKL